MKAMDTSMAGVEVAFVKCNNGKNHRPLQNKPVPAARSSRKKDSKNKVQMVKPARQPKPKWVDPAKLKKGPRARPNSW